ncbi:RNA-directed DNA polymerase-like protein [Cucumis melo var. makuwa]|uniref:RNA-directed DNA polymerase-like protein n=1 Tax=Cucumis melo var. makuwa TaxID=1194695 RepID=A0A5A7VN17_CUCMM|nr:RNA-directed DNA polymerase-like protein [Cucumis melo var. makuwa]TYK04083.1 RNA-directed DNA polymerase-like protein [Cucumis melo var. makuwa]
MSIPRGILLSLIPFQILMFGTRNGFVNKSEAKGKFVVSKRMEVESSNTKRMKLQMRNGIFDSEDECDKYDVPLEEESDAHDDEYIEGGMCLVVKLNSNDALPSAFKYLLQEFNDMFPYEDAPMGLSSLRGIKHQIDFLPKESLPNMATYRTNPTKANEIRRQVKELMDKGYVRKSMTPYSILVILVPKKDGTWRMCVDCRAINEITVKYRHPISRLDDMLDELHGANLFSKN